VGKFACIIHPLDINLFSTFEPGVKNKRADLVKKIFEWSEPLIISEVTGLRSLTGKEEKGILVLYNILPEQLISLNSKFLLKQITRAGRIAEEWGADIFGLAAYTAQVGKKGVLVAKNLNIPVTTGTSYTIVVVIESILKAARAIGMNCNEASLCVIGATGSIGKIVAQLLSEYIPNVTLVGRNRKKLEFIADSLKNESVNKQITISEDIKDAVKNADIILTATNSPYALININDVKSGSLVCDVSLPKNVTQESANTREDILVIDGGIVQPPGQVDFNFCYGLPAGLCYACMAETMLLALDESYDLCSVGGDISFEKIKQIGLIAKKHGFELAEFRSFGKKVDQKHIEIVSEALAKRKNNILV
jgi:predicted amino acid dehydrogenase